MSKSLEGEEENDPARKASHLAQESPPEAPPPGVGAARTPAAAENEICPLVELGKKLGDDLGGMLKISVELNHGVRGQHVHRVAKPLEVGGTQALFFLLHEQVHFVAALLRVADDIRRAVTRVSVHDEGQAIPGSCREYRADELVQEGSDRFGLIRGRYDDDGSPRCVHPTSKYPVVREMSSKRTMNGARRSWRAASGGRTS